MRPLKVRWRRSARNATRSSPKQRNARSEGRRSREEGFTDDEKKRHAAADAEVQALKKKLKPFTTAMLMTDAEGEPAATHVLYQGQLEEPREQVAPGFLSALDPNPAPIAKPAREKSTGRRTALADWIVSERNPLTARVIVNRVWQAHFGEGLVATANDFGLAGARPSDPALLDWLAREFVRGGWSVEEAAPAHPHQRHLSPEPRAAPRSPPSNCATRCSPSPAGSCSCEGGPPVWPALPEEVLKANPAFLDDNAEKTKGWYPSPPEKLGVRSIFLVQKRNLRVPMMETFDLPENAVSCARRNVSTVAPQALTLLNSPFATETSRAFADRVTREAGDDPAAQIEHAFALALQRAPDDAERTACRHFRAAAQPPRTLPRDPELE